MVTALTTSERMAIWSAAVSAVVAVATLILAGVTARMAKKTTEVAEASREEAAAVRKQTEEVSRQADLTGAQLDLTRAALQASILPWLTLSEDYRVRFPSVQERPDVFKVRLVLRNVGRGIALLRPDEGLRMIGSKPVVGDEAHERFGQVSAAVVAPDSETVLRFLMDKRLGGPDLATYTGQGRGIFGEFFVEIDYTDVRAEQLTTARLHVCADTRASTGWFVASIEYRRAGEERPFTSVKFSI